jgi:hypothetical protein
VKHQYYGDINDYLKYGLLRCFAASGFRVGVCWMLTPDDGRPDGRKIEHLSDPTRWKVYDAELFDTLSATVRGVNGRHVHHVENGSILSQARFFGRLVSDGVQDRALWFKNAMEILDECDLLFFDPDNGIEIPSKPCGRKNSSKYVYWKELETAWNQEASLLVFQHFTRVNREKYIARLMKETAERTPGATIFPL